MVIKCIRRRIDVFGYSGNIVVGDHNSGDLIFTQNSQQRIGSETGCAQTGYGDLRKNAIGRCGLRNMAGGDGGISATLGTRPFSLSLSRRRSGSADLDNILGVNRIPEEMMGYASAVAGHWMLNKRFYFATLSFVPNSTIHIPHSEFILRFPSNRSLLQPRAYRR